MTVTVRRATPVDGPAMGRIKRDGWRAAYAGLIPAATLDAMDADLIASRFAADIADASTGLPGADATGWLVAEVAGAVVGYAVVGPYRGDDLVGAGEVYAIYVDPGHWGEGAGRRLLEAAEGWLDDRGHRIAVLWVLEGNRVGRGFYEALGWRPDGATGRYCEGGDALEVRYRRPLAG